MSTHIINTRNTETQPTTRSALHWAFALVIGVLSVFTVTADHRSTAPSDSPAHIKTSTATGAIGTQASKTDTLLTSRPAALLSRLLTGFVDHSNNPENTDPEHGLKIELSDSVSAGHIAVQQARFYFLVSSIHEAPYTPRSPPFLA